MRERPGCLHGHAGRPARRRGTAPRLQRVGAQARVVAARLHEAGVHHIAHAGDRDRRLRDVGGQDHLPGSGSGLAKLPAPIKHVARERRLSKPALGGGQAARVWRQRDACSFPCDRPLGMGLMQGRAASSARVRAHAPGGAHPRHAARAIPKPGQAQLAARHRQATRGRGGRGAPCGRRRALARTRAPAPPPAAPRRWAPRAARRCRRPAPRPPCRAGARASPGAARHPGSGPSAFLDCTHAPASRLSCRAGASAGTGHLLCSATAPACTPRLCGGGGLGLPTRAAAGAAGGWGRRGAHRAAMSRASASISSCPVRKTSTSPGASSACTCARASRWVAGAAPPRNARQRSRAAARRAARAARARQAHARGLQAGRGAEMQRALSCRACDSCRGRMRQDGRPQPGKERGECTSAGARACMTVDSAASR